MRPSHTGKRVCESRTGSNKTHPRGPGHPAIGIGGHCSTLLVMSVYNSYPKCLASIVDRIYVTAGKRKNISHTQLMKRLCNKLAPLDFCHAVSSLNPEITISQLIKQNKFSSIIAILSKRFQSTASIGNMGRMC